MSARAPGGGSPRGLMVLVVEDEFLIAMDLEAMLRGHGWRVLGPAATVAEALRLLDGGETPDVALLDVNLRGRTVSSSKLP
jgi:CheY-like chemotaxis protein